MYSLYSMYSMYSISIFFYSCALLLCWQFQGLFKYLLFSPSKSHHFISPNVIRTISTPKPILSSPPSKEMKFNSLHEAENYYYIYAGNVGFSVRKSTVARNGDSII
ncbi:hypothetical protein ZOSMA_62G00180 [Zostera marina]|uniref:Uncharacterized protein n=1 Tax=Zostera marina TaxID=29655 RepID=A0A0K9NVG0_ZOSMR|nr:hypothetical protein ZOSMA_62G00180 [Zostera marina]